MGQRYSDQELARSRAADKRDEHAHARIDELQRMLANMLTELAIADIPADQRTPKLDVSVALKVFKDGDRRVEKRMKLR